MLSGGPPRGRSAFGEEEPVRAPGGKRATTGDCTWLGAQLTESLCNAVIWAPREIPTATCSAAHV